MNYAHLAIDLPGNPDPDYSNLESTSFWRMKIRATATPEAKVRTNSDFVASFKEIMQLQSTIIRGGIDSSIVLQEFTSDFKADKLLIEPIEKIPPAVGALIKRYRWHCASLPESFVPQIRMDDGLSVSTPAAAKVKTPESSSDPEEITGTGLGIDQETTLIDQRTVFGLVVSAVLERFRLSAPQLSGDGGLSNTQYLTEHLLKLETDEYLYAKRCPLHPSSALSPSTRLSICIPVAVYAEGDKVIRTLELLARQNKTKEFEVILNLNFSSEQMADPAVSPGIEELYNQVAQWQEDNQDRLQLKYYECMFEKKSFNIGSLRQQLFNKVALRLLENQRGEDDYYIVSMDADLMGIKPDYVQNLLKTFKDNPASDAIAGQIDFDWFSYCHDPRIYLAHRLHHAVSSYTAVQSGKASGSGGANTAFRVASLARVGGYQNLKVGEDMDVCRRLTHSRGDRANPGLTPVIVSGGAKTRIITSARRSRAAVSAGFTANEQWFNPVTAFDAEKHQIRMAEESDISDDHFLKVLNSEAFPAELTKIINHQFGLNGKTSLPQIPSRHLELIEAVVKRGFGIDYRISQQGQVVIDDYKLLEARLLKFQKSAIKHWEQSDSFLA